VQHRPLDHRRLGQHQLDGLAGVEIGLGLGRQGAEGRAGAVQHRLPAVGRDPALQRGAVDPGLLVVVKGVGDAVLVQPDAGLLDGGAVRHAVEGRGHGGGIAADAAGRPEPSVSVALRRSGCAVTNLHGTTKGGSMSETLRLMAAAGVAGLVAFPAAAQVPAHEQAWLDRWNVTPQMRYDTPRLLESSRIASRLDEAERAAREGDQVAYVLVALEHNRRCKGGRRIVREACAAYAAWRGEWGAVDRTEVSPAWRSFHMGDNRRDGLRLRALEAGQLIDLGVGGPAEPATAQLFYQLALLSDDAAEQAEANYRLGRMHEDGRLGADLSQARRLETIRTHYSRAAEAGHPMAAYDMAHISLAEAGDGGPAHLKTWAAG